MNGELMTVVVSKDPALLKPTLEGLWADREDGGVTAHRWNFKTVCGWLRWVDLRR